MNHCDLSNKRYEASIIVYNKYTEGCITEDEYKKELYTISQQYGNEYLRNYNLGENHDNTSVKQ
jgi:hypothetical protein